MSQQLINHSQDLQSLQREGFVIDIRNGFIFLKRVPYLNSKGEIKYGTLVSQLELAGNKTKVNPGHTAYFAGEMPHRKDGTPLTSVVNSSRSQVVAGDFTVNHYLSNKPKSGYRDYYEKMTNYVNMISCHAKAVDSTVSEKAPNKLSIEDDSVFQYSDTNSNKPELSPLNNAFFNQKIGIVGVGGTGSYILDLVSKTPVMEIHLHDGDWFYNNNAFRAPGATPLEELIEPQKKVDYFKKVYSNIHQGVKAHSDYINEENIETLQGYDFVFLSLDKGDIKKSIIMFLEQNAISFVDLGMGIHNTNGSLTGVLRTTLGVPRKTDFIWRNNVIPFEENDENEYSSNIQIAELNALNAAFAVIKWKKMIGYYHDLEDECNSFFRLNSNKIANEKFGD